MGPGFLREAGPLSFMGKDSLLLTSEDLRRAAIGLFGERGWMSRLAEALGVDRSSVSRWFAGLPVPGPVAAAVTAWQEIYRLTGKRPGPLPSPPATPQELPERRGRRPRRSYASQAEIKR